MSHPGDEDRPRWLDVGSLRYEKEQSFLSGLAAGFLVGCIVMTILVMLVVNA